MESPRLNSSVYLCGAITGLTYGEACGWRDHATKELLDLGYDVFSPMREKLQLSKRFDTLAIPHTDAIFQDPFERDILDVRRSDFIIANMWRVNPMNGSVGTYVELGVAFGLGKYVIVVNPEGDDLHPFITGPANVVVPTIDDAINLMAQYRPVRVV